jgi:PAS domain S-box-containing protein
MDRGESRRKPGAGRARARHRRDAEVRLRQLTANAGDIIYRYRIRPSVACEYINPAVTRITGFTPEDCYADPFLPRRRVHPADAAHFRQLIASPRLSEPAAFRWLHRDGSERLLELLNVPVRDAAGQVVAIEGVARDVTRVYEQELALRVSEERHRTLFENLAQGVIHLDRAQGRVTLNAAAEEMLGLSAAQLQRLGAAALIGFEEDGSPLSSAALPGTVAAETGRTVPHRVVRLLNHREGRYRWVLMGARPLLQTESGPVLAVHTTLTDITALHEAEAELRDTRELFRQAQKMEAVGRLAGGIAHDFNNLITAVRGYAALLLEALPADSSGRADAAEIVRAADRAAALTRQLLAFSRRQVLEPRVLRLDAVVRQLEQMLRRVLGDDITLVLQSQQELWPVLADAVQVEQVLLNLVVNSRDALQQGGRIEIQLRNVMVPPGAADYSLRPLPGEYVALSVADMGTGMSAEVLGHIFEPFFTTKEVGRGTGLGLATVYGIVQQSGGGIRVESIEGEGTLVEVLFPRAQQEPEPVAPPAPVPAGGGERILLVEDERPVGELIRRMLESAGYLVDAAASGAEALALASASETGYDLLLTDVIMPGLNGSELAGRFLLRFPAARVLYTSGYSDDLGARHGVLQPPGRLLEKPFTQETLERAVRTALDAPSNPPAAG